MKAELLKTHPTFSGLTQFWEHDSRLTQTKMKFSTFVPEKKPKGALIWLSGLTCTDENFITKAGAQKYLQEHQLMVICPDTSPRGLSLPNEHDSYDFGSGASFYLDAQTDDYKDHYKMESYITEEVIEILTDQFQIQPTKISISGHSMGGHGALTLGLKHPAKFAAVSAFAPITNPTKCPWGEKAFQGYLKDQNEWAKHDSTELVLAGQKHPAKILIDQGTADDFYKSKQLLPENFSRACSAQNQNLILNFRENYDHSYYFISTFIESHIHFHSEIISG